MRIKRQIEDFDRAHRWLRQPLGAEGMCCWASELFASRVPGATVLHLRGSRRHFLDRVDDYPARDNAYYHTVVRVGRLAIDWTRRQLDPKAPHPFIQSFDDLRRDWIMIKRSWDEIEREIFVVSRILVPTVRIERTQDADYDSAALPAELRRG